MRLSDSVGATHRFELVFVTSLLDPKLRTRRHDSFPESEVAKVREAALTSVIRRDLWPMVFA